MSQESAFGLGEANALLSNSAAHVLDAEAIESILADFRAWLQQAKEIAPAAPAPSFDLATVVQHFIALRQEINLQTRASRTQMEQTALALDLLRTSQEAFKQEQTRQSETAGAEQAESLRPILKSLIDAHDALALARRELQRKLDQPAVPGNLKPEVRGLAPLPFWTRWLGLAGSIQGRLAAQEATLAAGRVAEAEDIARRARTSLDTLLVGYEMSLQRLERAMHNHGLEPLSCSGAPFDPETMEVVEVVRVEGRIGIEVLEEVRPGYVWQGRLFRFAQVRVVRS